MSGGVETPRLECRFSGLWRREGGFTLAEVLATIIIMGIVFAIASSSWFSVVESRRVDSAANQVASDLRLANNSASNRLNPYEVCLTSGSSTYRVGPSDDAGLCAASLDTRTLPDNTQVATTVTIAFCPNGSAQIPPGSPVCSAASAGSPTAVTVSSADGAPSRDIEVVPATSRVELD